MWFGDDESDDKKAVIVEQDKSAFSETLKEDARQLGQDLTAIAKQAIEEIKTELESEETTKPPAPEPEKQPDVKPMDDKPKDKGMKNYDFEIRQDI